jgi:hypothetical protein
MGERDIRRMHAGTMDPQGRSQTVFPDFHWLVSKVIAHVIAVCVRGRSAIDE